MARERIAARPPRPDEAAERPVALRRGGGGNAAIARAMLHRQITREGYVYGIGAQRLFWARAIVLTGGLPAYQIGESPAGPWYDVFVSPDTRDFIDAPVQFEAPVQPSFGPPVQQPVAAATQPLAPGPLPFSPAHQLGAPGPAVAVPPAAANAPPPPIALDAFQALRSKALALKAVEKEADAGRSGYALELVADWNQRAKPFQKIVDDDLEGLPGLGAAQQAGPSLDTLWTATTGESGAENAASHFGRHSTVLGVTYPTVEAYVEAAYEAKRSATHGYTQQRQGGKTHWVTLVTATLDGDPRGWRGKIAIFDERVGRMASFYELNDQSARAHGYASVPHQLFQLEYGKQPSDRELPEFIARLRSGR